MGFKKFFNKIANKMPGHTKIDNKTKKSRTGNENSLNQRTLRYLVGYAQREINPKKDVALVGYLRNDLTFGTRNDGILDSLFVKVLIIDDGINQSAIIAYDLLGLDDSIVSKIKNNIAARNKKLRSKDILVAATHTHSAPGASIFIQADWQRDLEYNEYLFSQTLLAFDYAQAHMNTAKLSYGTTSCDWNYYRHTKRSIEADHEVSIIRFDSEKNTIVLFVYACHPVILRTCKVSSDYVGFARKRIEEAKVTGKDTFSLFLNGCGGNINPYHPQSRQDISEHDPSWAVRMGNELGDIVNNSIQTMAPLQERPISNKLTKIRDISKVINGFTTIHPIEIQMLEFAGIRLITIPGEPFVETGYWIKKNFDKTIPVGYANENIGYIPTPEYFDDPRDARYEVSGAGKIVYGITIPQDLEPHIRTTIGSMISGIM